MIKNFDLIVIGAGPAGVSGVVYSARKHLKTLLISPEYGGQSAVSPEIRNWIGTPKISGFDLAKNLESHVKDNMGEYLETENDTVSTIEKNDDAVYKFKIATSNGKTFWTRSILVACGCSRKKIDAKNAINFENLGVVYCASCDGPLFSGQNVSVVGGGNSGFESALQLLAYCPTVTMFLRGENGRADETTMQTVLSNPNFKIIKNAIITEIYGDQFVSGLKYKLSGKDEEFDFKTNGVFVEIGQIPNTAPLKNLVQIDEYGKIVTDPKTQKTSAEGIWAAGDITDGLYHQNNIAAGDAVKAVENIYLWLKK